MYGHFRSLDWVATPAVVVKVEKMSKGAKLTYRYKVDNAEYIGNKFAFLTAGSIPDGTYIISNYGIENNIIVFTNPSAPKESVVLKRKMEFKYLRNHVLMFTLSFLFGLELRRQLQKDRIRLDQ